MPNLTAIEATSDGGVRLVAPHAEWSISPAQMAALWPASGTNAQRRTATLAAAAQLAVDALGVDVLDVADVKLSVLVGGTVSTTWTDADLLGGSARIVPEVTE